MPMFSYTAKSNEGRRVQDKMEAADLATAERELAASHTVVYSVEEESDSSRNLKILAALAPVQLEELVGLSQAIASMADGGISIKRTIDILLEDTENATMRRILTDISQDLGGGNTLSQALSRHSAVFPSYYVAMTEAGESSGNLPEMMRRLADILTAVESLEARAKAALSYPLLLFCFTLTSFFCFFAYGSPYLARIYESLELTPPILTRVLLGFGTTLGDNKFAVVVLLAGTGFLVWNVTRKKGSGRIAFDKLRLSLPILGNVYRVLYTARFMRTMAILYRSGLGLAPSVRLAAATIGNDVVTEDLFDLSLKLDQGDELASTLRSSVHVSRLAVGMIAAGEECGKLETMLTKVADVYDVKSETLLQNVRSRIEPAVMLCLGVTIALLLGLLGWPMVSLLAG